MRIILQTRCGCNKFTDIAVGQAPANIQIELVDNAGLGIAPESCDDKPVRRFTYVGTQKGSNIPLYVETLDQEGYGLDQPLATVVDENYDKPETD